MNQEEKNNIEFLEKYAKQLKESIEQAKAAGAEQIVIIKQNNLKKVLLLLEALK